jgi:hypothetical protein
VPASGDTENTGSSKERIMTKRIKALLGVVLLGVLVYLVSAASVSMAEVGSAAAEERVPDVTVLADEELTEDFVLDDAEERLADVMVSLEACVVRVDVEALEESAGGGFLALSSVSAESLLSRIGGEEAEAVSGVKLLVGNGTEGEISTEDNAREKARDVQEEVGEHASRDTAVSLRAEALVAGAGKIVVEFSFKQVISEDTSSGSVEGEHEEEVGQVFEVSSTVGLQAGRPRVVGARKSEDQAMFLILHADI